MKFSEHQSSAHTIEREIEHVKHVGVFGQVVNVKRKHLKVIGKGSCCLVMC